MNVALGSDHAGFAYKEALKEMLTADGHSVIDVGTSSTDSVDYPDYGTAAAHLVRDGKADAGVLARAIVRLAMSYVSMPPEADHDVAADLARLMTPFAERYGLGAGPQAD